jgi:uridine monophosphate synthetase|tara:strand:+ start:743 stop:1369 length:627 start_codon:yes stop_codon:yes gene_type:complete
MISQTAKKLATQLLDTESVKFGAFKLKLHETNPDAPLSPIYIDLRIMRSFPNVMATAVEVYQAMIKNISFELLADCPTSATPATAILSYLTKRPMISPRKGDKGYGSGAKIDGSFRTDQTAVLIDDLITSANSKFEAIETLQGHGLVVKDVVVLLDREQGGADQLKKAGYILHSALKLTELMDYYLGQGKISDEKYKETLNYIKAQSV